MWKSIEEAPKDREVLVYCLPAHGLRELFCRVKWSEYGGFCVDELRTPILYTELPEVTVGRK